MMICTRLGRTLAIVVCGALAAASAFANEEKSTWSAGPPSPVVAANCDLLEHKMGEQLFAPPTTVPDNTAAGVTFGPIILPADAMFIGHVVLDLDLAHTWIGDLIVRLDYDENSDGAVDVSSIVMCRPGRTGSCGAAGATLGCGSNFTTGAFYRFDDTATNFLPTSGCNTAIDIAGGCFRPTGVGAGPLSAFEGRTKGGRWWLFVSDNANGDVLSFTRWAVHILNTPVSALPASWGQVKVRYR